MTGAPGIAAASRPASAMTSSPALSQRTASSAERTSGEEYSGCAWSTYSLAPLVRMTLASPTSSSVSWLASARSRLRSKPRASRSGFSSSKSQRGRRPRLAVAAAYALTTCDDASMAFAVGCPGTEMPYSVSMPITRLTLTLRAYDSPRDGHGLEVWLEVLAGVGDGVDGAA